MDRIEDTAVDDARIDQLIRRLDERPPVRVDFATTLHDRLSSDLGFGRAAGRRWFGFARIAGAGPRTAPWPQLRTAWIIALVALLAAALAGGLAVGSRLLVSDPSELVRRSLAAYAEPPAFAETFSGPTRSQYRLSADGAGTWRIEALHPSGTDVGSYDVYDGTRLGHYDVRSRVWTSGSLAEMSGGLPPFPFDNDFTWSRVVTRADGSHARVQASCEGAELRDEAPVAGRTTDHVRCPDTGIDVWLDRESHLILRLEAGPDAQGWEPGASVEVTALSFGAPADRTAFSFDGPKDAFAPDDQPPSHSLQVGDAMPDLSGPLVGGGGFHTASLAGRPAAVFVWCPCVAGPEMRLFSDAVGRRADRLGAAVVLEATAADATATVADVAFDGPAIVDETGVIDPLGLNYWPVLVLVDPEGRIVSLSHQVRDPAELDAMLDALLADEPIPAPTWIPGSGDVPGTSTALAVGQVAPDWSVPTEDGRTLAAHDLVGKRTIVYYGLPQGGDDFAARNDAILEDLDAAQRADPGLRVIVVDAFAATKDTARAALDSLAVDLPLVADRDGIIGSTWGLAYYPTLVFLDESGRVAWYGAGSCIDMEALMQPFEHGSPMPSPALAPSCP